MAIISVKGSPVSRPLFSHYDIWGRRGQSSQSNTREEVSSRDPTNLRCALTRENPRSLTPFLLDQNDAEGNEILDWLSAIRAHQ
jgi:hypothetical protein